MKSKSDWLIQEPLLSPTKSLFFEYLNWKKSGNWNQQTFNDLYVPRFIKELKSDPRATSKLNELYKSSAAGKTIALCCFCTDEAMCHRSIVAGLLQGAGADVRVGSDYSHYYSVYCGT